MGRKFQILTLIHTNLAAHSQVCSFLTVTLRHVQAYVNSPDEEDLYDYLYEDGGPPQEEEDDIRRAVQER